MTPPNPRPNALRWVRETLDLSQSEMASRLGCTEATIRFRKRPAEILPEIRIEARETNRPRRGSADAKRTRRPAAVSRRREKCFPPGAKRRWEPARTFPLADAYRRFSRMRSYCARFVLQGLIADELGPAGCLHTGFYDALQKMNAKLLWKIPNSKTRHRVFQRSRDMGDEEIAEYFERAAEATQGSHRGRSQQHEKAPLALVAIW